MFSLRLAFNLVTRPGYTCRCFVIFGTLCESLLINSLALNICFDTETFSQNGVDALSKIPHFCQKAKNFM